MPHTPPLEFLAIEAVYSSFIFLICAILYHRLRGVYRLTDYRGLYFFSNTFLFLGLAYLVRFVVVTLLASGVLFEGLRFEGLRGLMVFSFAFLAYSSSAAILYTIYSLLWRWFERFPGDVLIHAISLLISVSAVVTRPPLIFILSQLVLIVVLVAAILINYRYKPDKRVKKVYSLYILLFVFMLLNISLIFGFLPMEWRLVIYTSSVAVVVLIAYRVLKKL